jgi:hypothetical protein
MSTTRAVLAFACSLASACSFAFVKPVPSGTTSPSEQVACTTSYVVPVIDYLIAASAFSTGLFLAPRLLGLEASDRGVNWDGLKGLGFAVLVALPWYVGGEIGRRRVRNCRVAHTSP